MKTVFVLLAGGVLLPAPDPSPPAAEPRTAVIVIAHRGASGYLPEHTLPAVAMAHAQGADFIEQDVVLSKDDVPVVLHDVHLDTVTDVARRFPDRRRADGRYYALDFTLAELKQLAVSERFDAGTGAAVFPSRFPPGTGGFQIPTLEEELQVVAGLNRSTGRTVGIYPEIKEPAWHRQQGRDISRIVLAVLARYGYQSKTDAVYLQCFDPSEVKRIRRELGYRGRLVQLLEADRPGQPSEHGGLRTPAGLRALAEVADGIGPPLSDVVVRGKGGRPAPTDLVRDAHAAGLVVHPYTFRADVLPPGLSSFEDLLSLFVVDAGVDGLFTDHPDRAVAFLKTR